MSVPKVDHVTVPTNREWRKATASGVQNDCVELTFFGGGTSEEGDMTLHVGVRDSKAVALGGTPLVLPLTGLTALIQHVA